jgi:hypothetical protein
MLQPPPYVVVRAYRKHMSEPKIKTKLDRPVIFRTCDKDVYEASLSSGSIWLRSSRYYREIEDVARQDRSEGVNGTSALFPLRFAPGSAQAITLEGLCSVGQEIVLHYLMLMHGTSITEVTRNEFGGYTLGIRCIADLAADIVYQISKQVPVNGYRYGQVAYQRTALTMPYNPHGSAIELSGSPSVHVKSINTDVLRKDPVEPFIGQDEWRIAIFTNKYLNNDPDEPLKINVDPNHFYGYIKP